MIPGLVTGLVYFLGRDIYAAIVIQNFAGMIGVGRKCIRRDGPDKAIRTPFTTCEP